MKNTPPSVIVAPSSCSGVRVSPKRRYPVAAAKHGVENVRLESVVKFPLEAFRKNTP